MTTDVFMATEANHTTTPSITMLTVARAWRYPSSSAIYAAGISHLRRPFPGPVLHDILVDVEIRFPNQTGRLDDCTIGQSVSRTIGRSDDRTIDGTMDGTMGRWEDGTMGRWDDGTMGRWDDGTTGRWDDGTMRESPKNDGSQTSWC